MATAGTGIDAGVAVGGAEGRGHTQNDIGTGGHPDSKTTGNRLKFLETFRI